ncbi:HK97 gp10 family phage protein [Devosia rhodophyticola]|uniref:HK97 gp10 family phage protein n=1 Tax=Devosia rhodophyticola TaxID=3026423 RepID=A0ABY7Z271_9HYPH|nr:HK97-gp10 family putative phage morphogenesis protein [Devosia rhodophyticola]WDR07300.1 HK97 gp10 family phage protein [Devosia rhodophyticola]
MADDGGIGRLQRRLAAIPVAMKAGIQPTLLKQGNAVANTMRLLAPDDPATDAPDLKSSIVVTTAGQTTPPYSQPSGTMIVPENAVAITVGNSDVRYPHLVEYGTKKSSAQPFFWPAVRLNRKKFQAAIKRAVGKAVREAGK